MKNKFIFLLCIIWSHLVIAQVRESVTVRVIVPTPHTDRLSYYGEPGRMVVTITNRTNQAQEIYLRGSIKGTDNDRHIFTDPNFRPDNSYAISIPAGVGQTVTVPSGFIQNVYHTNNIIYSGTSANDIKRAGRLGEGCYMVCLSAWDMRNHTLRLSAEETGCTMICVKNIEAPLLIKPYTDEIIKPLPIQNVIFSWNRPAGTPPNVKYKLKIVEIYDAKRNPNDAFLSSTTPAFFEEEVMGNAYVYGPSAPALEEGRRYAWAVTAIDPNGETAFQNGGRSEVRSFTYKAENNALPIENNVVSTKSKAIEPSFETSFKPNFEITNLFLTQFKGKLVWSFRKSETGIVPEVNLQTLYSNLETPKVPTNIGGFNEQFSALEKPLKSGSTSSTSSSNKTFNLDENKPSFNVLGGGNTRIYIGKETQNKTVIAPNIVKRSLHQNQIIAIADDIKYPLVNTKVSLYLKPKSYSKTPTVQNPILAGQGYTNDQGEFFMIYNGQIPEGYEGYLSIDNPHFEFADYEIPLKAGLNGQYDLGELRGIAKTYRLKLAIVNDDQMNLDAAKFKIVRTKRFYTGTNINLGKEGLKADSTFSEQEIVAQGTTQGFFSRLFFSKGTADIYTLIIEGENIKRTQYNINFNELVSSGTTYAEIEKVPILEKKYVANMPLPVVEGRVVTRNGEIPVQGATVRVRKKGSNSGQAAASSNGWLVVPVGLEDRVGVTDSLGKFKIENIPVNSTPYELYISYKGKSTVIDQDLYLSQKGVKEIIDPVYIHAELITVTGKVIDLNGEPLPDATLTWKTGGNAFYSDDEGNFIGSQVEGKHILVVRKPGYKDTEYPIELKVTDKKMGAFNSNIALSQTIQNWTTNVSQALASTTGKGTYNNTTISPKPSPYKNVPITTSVYTKNESNSPAVLEYYGVFKHGLASSEISSGHVIVMSKFFVKAIVKDHLTNQAIQNAVVSAEFSDKHVLTNALGEAIVENVPGGNSAIVVSGPKNSFYSTIKSEIILEPSKDTAVVELSLKAGSSANGIVRQNGAPLANAEVSVEGLEYIHATTDSEGKYTLVGIPVGEYTLQASKEGMLGESKSQNFEANKSYTIDFTLKDPGFNASQLLGFKMVLHKSKPGPGENEFIISGELRDLPDNPVFKILNGNNFRLKFTDKTIIKSGNKIYPKGGELTTDVSEIPLKVYDYLVVKLKNKDGIKVRALAGSNNEQGEIIGEGLIDMGATFSSITGISLPSVPINLTYGNNTIIAPINSKGDISTSTFGIKTSNEEWKLYGIRFLPDFAASGINKDGINLKGKIKLEDIPLLSNQEFDLKLLTLTKRGEIKNAEVNMSPPPTLSIVSWKLKLTGIKLNQYGIKFSGDLDVPIPSSSVAKIGVKDLGINNNLLTGGTFAIPSTGIDIFNVVSFKTEPGRDFTFQKMAGTNHYRFIGSGNIKFTHAQWLKDGIVLDNFSIGTNGEFSVIAKTGVEVNFADMAQLGITKFGFNSQTSTITVGGKFRLNIPMFGAGAEGTLHFQKGRAPRMDELGIHFSLASAIALEAKLAFGNNEFRGKGGLKLANMTGVELEFWYQKLANGKKIGANFMAHAVIPIGVVNLSSLQGGFDFNTAEDIYKIWAGGKITLGVDPAGVVALDPVKVAITSSPQGPIFQGDAKVTVMTEWKIGEAKMVLNFGQKRFTIDGSFGGEIKVMKGLSAESKTDLFVELYTGQDWYWVVATTAKTKIANIFNSNVTIAGGWNVPKSSNATLSGIPDFVLTNGRLYGGYFNTSTSIRVPKTTVDFTIGKISIWYENTGLCEVYANFKEPVFGFKVASKWAVGGSVEVVKWEVASADLLIQGGLNGYYASNRWGLEGSLSGHARVKFGCNADCNSIGLALFIPCGFRICAAAGVNVSYINNKFDFKLRFSE